jgi:hypothetical protein
VGSGGTLVLAMTDFLNEFDGAGVEALTASLSGFSLGVAPLTTRGWRG